MDTALGRRLEECFQGLTTHFGYGVSNGLWVGVSLIAIYLITTPTIAIPVDINDPDVQESLHYDLIIDASNNEGKDGKYEAVVHVRDGRNKHFLVSFKPAN
ncbi:hypothetical protein EJB05_53295, partial [Eragrostis curvula]